VNEKKLRRSRSPKPKLELDDSFSSISSGSSSESSSSCDSSDDEKTLDHVHEQLKKAKHEFDAVWPKKHPDFSLKAIYKAGHKAEALVTECFVKEGYKITKSPRDAYMETKVKKEDILHPRVEHFLNTLAVICLKKDGKNDAHKVVKKEEKVMKRIRKINTCKCGKIAKYMKVRPYSISVMDDLQNADLIHPAMHALQDYLWKLNAVGRRKLMEHKTIVPFFREEENDSN
jgi:hypothetical protein